MTIRTRSREHSFIEIIVENNNCLITEDLSVMSNDKRNVSSKDIEQFITVANDCSRFNGDSDVVFVKKIFDAFLSDHEKEQFLELVSSSVSKEYE